MSKLLFECYWKSIIFEQNVLNKLSFYLFPTTMKKLLLLIGIIVSVINSNYAETFTVTTTASSGSGSLDSIMDVANNNGSFDTIIFASSLSGSTIPPPNYVGSDIYMNGDINGDNLPDIIIRDTSSLELYGFDIDGDDVTIRGFVIGGFVATTDGAAIHAEGSNIIIEYNYIGTTLDGLDTMPNLFGIYISNDFTNSVISNNLISANYNGGIMIKGNISTIIENNKILSNIIGLNKTMNAKLSGQTYGIFINRNSNLLEIGDGTSTGKNIISGNMESGIHIDNSIYNTVNDVILKANYIGVGSNGKDIFANGHNGIYIEGNNQIQNFLIGGATASEGNVISGNDSCGIFISANFNSVSSPEVNIFNNKIGIAADGITPAGNKLSGIRLIDGVQNDTILNNIIAYNADNGIELSDANTFNNIFNINSIYSNGSEAIYFDLDNDNPQNGVQAPNIDSLVGDILYGTARVNATVYIYTDKGDQARYFLDATMANGNGEWSYELSSIPYGLKITALQEENGNTSELSDPLRGYILTGNAFYKDLGTRIDTGTVELYLVTTNNNSNVEILKLINTAIVEDYQAANFNFENLFEGTYMLKCQPYKPDYPNSVPTWYRNSIKWFDGEKIPLTADTFFLSLIVQAVAPRFGPGTIEGVIEEGAGFGKVAAPGEPLGGIDISLIDKSTSSPVAFIESSNDGGFDFNDLALGKEYLIHADIAGIPIDTNTTYTLTEENNDIDNILIVADSNMIRFTTQTTGLNSSTNKDAVEVYPNPFVDVINIRFNLQKEESITLNVYSITGQKVVSKTFKQSEGYTSLYYRFADVALEAGSYIIELQTSEGTVRKELMHVAN